jgi:triosephosphate isomerase
MHGLEASLDEARAMAGAVDALPPACRVALFPPATLLHRMAEILAGSTILVGGQDCRPEPQGAFTGDVAAEMLADAGARLVILGHSERRTLHGETDSLVAAKSLGAVRAGLEPIICVGETLAERQAGRALDIVVGQVRGSVPAALAGHPFALAYEPVWAIGSGLTPTLEEIDAVHRAIRDCLVLIFGEEGRAVPILYGGSVKPDNAGPILALAEVSGALVGGASLKADAFMAIVRSV